MAPRNTAKLSQVKKSNCLLGQQRPAVCHSLCVPSGNNIIWVSAGLIASGNWSCSTAAGNVVTLQCLVNDQIGIKSSRNHSEKVNALIFAVDTGKQDQMDFYYVWALMDFFFYLLTYNHQASPLECTVAPGIRTKQESRLQIQPLPCWCDTTSQKSTLAVLGCQSSGSCCEFNSIQLMLQPIPRRYSWSIHISQGPINAY